MKTGLYEPVEFNTRLSVAEVASCLQKEGAFDLRQWRCEVQDGRFAILPVVDLRYSKHRFFWPEAYGSLMAHGSGTTVRLAFRPMAEGWVAWAFAVLVVLVSLIFTAATGGVTPMLIFAVWDAILLLICGLIVRSGKRTVVETVKQLLEAEI